MSKTKDTGGSAFPQPHSIYSGMTLCDCFAGLAMQAAMTNHKGVEGFMPVERATWAYRQADAMLEARKRPKSQLIKRR